MHLPPLPGAATAKPAAQRKRTRRRLDQQHPPPSHMPGAHVPVNDNPFTTAPQLLQQQQQHEGPGYHQGPPQLQRHSTGSMVNVPGSMVNTMYNSMTSTNTNVVAMEDAAQHDMGGPAKMGPLGEAGPLRRHRRASSADASAWATQHGVRMEEPGVDVEGGAEADDVVALAQRAKRAAAIIEAAYINHVQKKSARQERRVRLRQR